MKKMRQATARRHRALCGSLLLGLACAGMAQAEAPMHTDDAGALAPGIYKVESVLRRDHKARGADLILGAGALPGLELGVGLSRDKDSQTHPATGLRGAGLTVKWAPLQEDTGWSMGARLDLGRMQVRDDAAPLRYTEHAHGVTALASYRWGQRALHLNAGYRTTRAQGERHHAATWAAGYEMPLAPQLQLTTEIYGEQRTRPDKAVGLRYTIADGLKVSTAAGRGNGRTFAQAGVAWEF